MGSRRAWVLVVALTIASASVSMAQANASRDPQPIATAPPPPSVITVSDMVISVGGSPTAALPRPRSMGPATYDLFYFAMPTSEGEVPLTEGEARLRAAAADAWFNRVTGGAFRFRFGGMRTLPRYPEPVCEVYPGEEALQPSLPLPLTPGADATIWVVVTPEGSEETCEFGGKAHVGRPGVWMKYQTNRAVDTLILTHEIGHNLGFRHSASVTSGTSLTPWFAGQPAKNYEEYGDTTDVMGGGFWGGRYGTVLRQPGLSLHHLNMLGLVSDAAFQSANPGTSATYTLNNVDGTGLRALYLPWLDRAKFVIDFRPTSYMAGQVGSRYGPGAGAYVRMVSSGDDTGPAPYGFIADTAALGWKTGTPTKIGLGAGKRMKLPDGSLVQIVTTSPSSAQVRVTRPADTQEPTFNLAGLGCTGDDCELSPEQALWDERGATYDLPTHVVSDDFWVAQLTVSLDGQALTLPDRPVPGTQETFSWQLPPLPPGAHSLTLRASDLSGNEVERTLQVTAPNPDPPVTGWWEGNPAFSFGWLEWKARRCVTEGIMCVMAAVRAKAPCPAGARATFAYLDEQDKVLTTTTQSTRGLASGELGYLVGVPGLEHWADTRLTSLSCG